MTPDMATPLEPQLRAATRSDVPLIVGLIRSASHEPWSDTLVAQVLDDPGCWGCIAMTDGGRPVGVVLARAAGGEAEILNLVVDPDMRRRGAGAALLREAVRETRARGAAALFLEVAVDNIAARDLYAQAGFDTVGKRADYYAHSANVHVDALIMRLNLITSRSGE